MGFFYLTGLCHQIRIGLKKGYHLQAAVWAFGASYFKLF
jgi:hypothetical protein